MKRAVLVLVACAGCGNFSQEDLLFLSALPTKEALALTPPGSEEAAPAQGIGAQQFALTQALDSCAEIPDQLRCHAQKIARDVNALTFGLLDLVDTIAHQPPTKRSPGRRIWGPFYVNDKGQDVSARFEMTRDGREFRYCLHFAPGQRDVDSAEDVTCDVDGSDEGFLRLLSGTFTAGEDADHRARTGAGTMRLDAARLPDPDASFPGIAAIEFAYDNTEGVQVFVDFLPLDETLRAPHFEFEKAEDGGGRFQFEIEANIGEEGTPAPEHLLIEAQWNADRAGRAEALVTEGDVPAGMSYDVTECWSAALDRVFVEAQWGDQTFTEGDVAECAIQTELIIAI